MLDYTSNNLYANSYDAEDALYANFNAPTADSPGVGAFIQEVDACASGNIFMEPWLNQPPPYWELPLTNFEEAHAYSLLVSDASSTMLATTNSMDSVTVEPEGSGYIDPTLLGDDPSVYTQCGYYDLSINHVENSQSVYGDTLSPLVAPYSEPTPPPVAGTPRKRSPSKRKPSKRPKRYGCPMCSFGTYIIYLSVPVLMLTTILKSRTAPAT
ncbi:hypothetical protein AX16_002900 [Volvariella volvacea WC 439]|nr:hypothetical protein AX16_002900 [Volvariella volvacea WC 439]